MEFEAFLLEVLSDFQITIPGSARSQRNTAYVFLTSNRTREIHDALNPLSLSLDEYPSFEKEYEIIDQVSAVEADASNLAFMQRSAEMNFYKRPRGETSMGSAFDRLNRKDLDDNRSSKHGLCSSIARICIFCATRSKTAT